MGGAAVRPVRHGARAAASLRFSHCAAPSLRDLSGRLLRRRRQSLVGFHSARSLLRHARGVALVRGDALRFIDSARQGYDIVFADPPYDMPGFAEIPGKVLASNLLKPGSVFIIEHSKAHDFSGLPHFSEHRAYGSVNFSIFIIPEEE